MATAEELRSQIGSAQRTYDEKVQLTASLEGDITQAGERQRLRRELEGIQARIRSRDRINTMKRLDIEYIDQDVGGPNMREEGAEMLLPERSKRADASQGLEQNSGEVLQCSKAVVKGEYEWKVEGFSWLESNLKQDDYQGHGYVETSQFSVGGYDFSLRYSPTKDYIGDMSVDGSNEEQKGSLAIISHEEDGVTFRYQIYLKNSSGDFISWGEVGNVCHPGLDTKGQAFGPDIKLLGSNEYQDAPEGIFGMSHKQLMQSDWVEADALTVKVELEVRRDTGYDKRYDPHVDVPPGRITKDLLTLLDEERCSDVTCIVQGVPIKAHSQILCARSEVFDRQLRSGLRESTTNEIVIDDCDAVAFKAFLQFLYTDDFAHAENLAKEVVTNAESRVVQATSSGERDRLDFISVTEARAALLQNLLAVSHKYQASRLQLWCEDQLCKHISVMEVCSVLCQAHLYEARQLEKACLTFITQHKESVMATPGFACLSLEWPAVLLKISIFMAGVPETKVTAAIEEHQKVARTAGGKRKREE